MGWGGVGLIFVYYFSLQFMTFPGLLIFWPPKIPTATPFGGFFFFFNRFSRQFMKFTGLWKCWPPTHPPGTPRGGMGKKPILLIFWTVHDISRSFDPLKFPLRPPLVGGGRFFYGFSRQFMKFTWLLILTPNPPPPPGGMGKKTKTPWVGRSIFLGRNHPQICRDLCKSASMIPSRTKFKCGAWRFWHVGASTVWGAT